MVLVLGFLGCFWVLGVLIASTLLLVLALALAQQPLAQQPQADG